MADSKAFVLHDLLRERLLQRKARRITVNAELEKFAKNLLGRFTSLRKWKRKQEFYKVLAAMVIKS